MKQRFLMTTAALAVAAALAQPAAAQGFTERALDMLRADGWTPVEAKQGPTQTKVEAVRNDTKIEVVWDNATGAILKQESEPFVGAVPDDLVVEIDDRNRDFVDDDEHDDDDDDLNDDGDDGEDDGDDHDNSGHDSDGDDHGDDHDSDHDSSGSGSGGDDGDHDSSGSGGGDDD